MSEIKDLRPFRQVTVCEKCGTVGQHKVIYRDLTPMAATTKDANWHNSLLMVSRQSFHLADTVVEFMERRCDTCGYEWAEDVYRTH